MTRRWRGRAIDHRIGVAEDDDDGDDDEEDDGGGDGDDEAVCNRYMSAHLHRI
jgi:hypothetical protein